MFTQTISRKSLITGILIFFSLLSLVPALIAGEKVSVAKSSPQANETQQTGPQIEPKQLTDQQKLDNVISILKNISIEYYHKIVKEAKKDNLAEDSIEDRLTQLYREYTYYIFAEIMDRVGSQIPELTKFKDREVKAETSSDFYEKALPEYFERDPNNMHFKIFYTEVVLEGKVVDISEFKLYRIIKKHKVDLKLWGEEISPTEYILQGQIIPSFSDLYKTTSTAAFAWSLDGEIYQDKSRQMADAEKVWNNFNHYKEADRQIRDANFANDLISKEETRELFRLVSYQMLFIEYKDLHEKFSSDKEGFIKEATKRSTEAFRTHEGEHVRIDSSGIFDQFKSMLIDEEDIKAKETVEVVEEEMCMYTQIQYGMGNGSLAMVIEWSIGPAESKLHRVGVEMIEHMVSVIFKNRESFGNLDYSDVDKDPDNAVYHILKQFGKLSPTQTNLISKRLYNNLKETFTHLAIPYEEDREKLVQGFSETSSDPTYGFTASNPIQVGGGPSNERLYLSMICGPEGQDLSFERLGHFDGFEVLVDGYEIKYKGIAESIILYIDMYTYNNPKAPKGFKIKSKYDKSIEDLNKAIALDPEDAIAYFERGSVYSNHEQDDKAIEDYNKAIELDPEFHTAYEGRGIVYVILKQYDKAIEDLNKAIELDPECATAYDLRGTAYGILKQYDKAIEDFNKAIELDPKNATYYHSRGITYGFLQQHNKAIELDSENVDAIANISELKIITDNYESALDSITKGLLLQLEIGDKAIILYLEYIAKKLLNIDTTVCEAAFNEIIKQDFVLRWDFEVLESWLKDVVIEEDTKRLIKEKTELLKKHL